MTAGTPIPYVIIAIAALAASIVPFGTVHDSAWVIIGALLTTPFLVAQSRPLRDPVMAPFLGLLALAAFLLVPLPRSIHNVLRGPLVDHTPSDLILPTGWVRPLAVDPHQTLVTLSWWIGVVVFIATISWGVQVHGKWLERRLSWCIVGAGLGVAAWGVVQRLVDAEQIGLGVPTRSTNPFFGPFVNVNHAAVLLLVATWMSAILIFRASSLRSRLLAGVCALTLAGSAILTGSRSPLLVLPLMAFAIVLWRGSRSVRLTLGTLSIAGLVVLLLVGNDLAFFFSEWIEPGSTYHGLVHARLQLWTDAWRIFIDTPVVGVGPGGFAELYPAYKSSFQYSRATHAHFDGLQFLIEMGLLGSLFLVVMSGMLVFRLTRGWRVGATDAAMLMQWAGAMATLLLPSLWGFPLRTGAMSLILALTVAVLIGAGRGAILPNSATPPTGWSRAIPGVVAIVFGMTTLLLPSTTIYGPRPEPPGDAQACESLVSAHPWDGRLIFRCMQHNSGSNTQKKWALAAKRADPTHPLVLATVAEAFEREGDANEALYAQVDAFAQDYPTDDLKEYILRRWLKNDATVQKAVEMLHKRRPARACAVADGALRSGRESAGLDWLQRGAQVDRSCALSWVWHLIQRDRAEEAGDILDKWRSHCALEIMDARLHIALDDPETAAAILTNAEGQCHSDWGHQRIAELRTQVSIISGQQPELDTALSNLTPHPPGSRSGAIRFRSVGFGLRRAGRTQEAIQVFEQLFLGMGSPQDMERLVALNAALNSPEPQ